MRYVNTRKNGKAELSWKLCDFVVRHVEDREVGQINIFRQYSQAVMRQVERNKAREEEEPVLKCFDFVVRQVEELEVGQMDIFRKHSQVVARKVKTHKALALPHWSDNDVIQFLIAQDYALWQIWVPASER